MKKPYLWRVTMQLPRAQRDMVLYCWHLAHDLRRHIVPGGRLPGGAA